MKFFAPLTLVLLLLCAATSTVLADKTASKADIMKAIETFQKDPSSKEGFAAAAVIINFAKTSPVIRISVTHETTPWLTDKNASDADTRNILLNAYIAGNVKAQLKLGHPLDDVYAGWEQVLDTYAQLLRINSAAKIEEVDELKKKDADGALQAYADSLGTKQ